MLTAVVLAAFLQSTTAAPTDLAEDPCTYDHDAVLALTPLEFDQTLDSGWRPLALKSECWGVAADLLQAYRKAHWGELKVGELHVNYWHEGQLRANLGQTQRAIRLLLAGVNPEVQTDGFQDYALGTVAFLNGDLLGLQAARARLAATPEPHDWQEAAARFRARFGSNLVWPMNQNVLDGLIACFGKPYSEAYGPTCTS